MRPSDTPLRPQLPPLSFSPTLPIFWNALFVQPLPHPHCLCGRHLSRCPGPLVPQGCHVPQGLHRRGHRPGEPSGGKQTRASPPVGASLRGPGPVTPASPYGKSVALSVLSASTASGVAGGPYAAAPRWPQAHTPAAAAPEMLPCDADCQQHRGAWRGDNPLARFMRSSSGRRTTGVSKLPNRWILG